MSTTTTTSTTAPVAASNKQGPPARAASSKGRAPQGRRVSYNATRANVVRSGARRQASNDGNRSQGEAVVADQAVAADPQPAESAGNAAGSQQKPAAALTPVHKAGFVAGVMRYVPEIVKGSRTDTYMKKIGFTLRYYAEGVGGDSNPHLAQACERSLATVRALAYLYSRGFTKILSVYGDPRDEKIAKFGNREAEIPMDLKRYSPFLTAKDGTRTPTTTMFSDLAKDRESLLMVDIYETTLEIPAPLSPHVIAKMCEALPTPFGNVKLVWVGRKFYGDVGVVAGEGAWKREIGLIKGDKIVYRASAGEPLEYQHDPCDWIWKTNSASVSVRGSPAILSWMVSATIGTMFVVVFHLSAGSMLGGSSELYPYDKQLVEVYAPSVSSTSMMVRPYLSFLPDFVTSSIFDQTTLYLYKPVFDKAYREVVNKRYTPTNFSIVSTSLIMESAVGDSRVLFDAFPEYHPQHRLTQFAWGVLMHKIAERHYVTSTAMAVGSSLMSQINTIQSSVGAPPSPTEGTPSNAWWIAKICCQSLALGVGLYKLCKFLRGLRTGNAAASLGSVCFQFLKAYPHLREWLETPRGRVYNEAISKTLIDILVSPLAEEIIKRVLKSQGFPTVMPLVELFVSLASEGRNLNLMKILTRLTVFSLHFVWLKQSLGMAVLQHTLWNLFITLCAELVSLGNPDQPAIWKFILILRRWAQDGKASFAGYFGVVSLLVLVLLCFVLRQTFKNSTILTVTQLYSRWKEDHYLTAWSERRLQEAPDAEDQVLDPATLESAEPSLTFVPEEGHLYQVSAPLPFIERAPAYFYHLLPTSYPGYVPQATYANIVAAVSCRLLRAPPMHPDSQAKAWKAFASSYGDIMKQFWFASRRKAYVPPWEEIVDKWVGHFRSAKKRRQYASIVKDMRSGHIEYKLPTTTDVFVKHDELLLQCKLAGQDAFYHHMKPRIISNVHPHFQAKVGPYVVKAQKRLKKIWNYRAPALRLERKNKTFYIHLSTAGDGTDQDLTNWMDSVLNYSLIPLGFEGYAIIGSGDDSLCAHVFADGTIEFFEGDASMFDSTQSRGPLKWQYEVMHQLGIAGTITNSLYKIAHNTYIVRPRKGDYDISVMQIQRSERPTRDTGGSDTYLGNTVVMISAWFFVLNELEAREVPLTIQSLQETFSELGFVMKFRHGSHDDVTFLKGMWYKTVDYGYVWGPLPSRVLKVGKSLSRPTDLYAKVEMRTASAMYLRDVARSYATFLQVPVLRAFVARYNCESLDPVHPAASIKQYAIQSSGLYSHMTLDEDAFIRVIQRYNFRDGVIERLEAKFCLSHPLQFLSHPGFSQMALVDYN